MRKSPLFLQKHGPFRNYSWTVCQT